MPDLAHVGVVQPVGAEKVLPHLGLLLTAVAQARICGEGDLDLVAAPVDKGHVDVNIADGRGEHVQIVQQQRRGKFHGKPDSKVLQNVLRGQRRHAGIHAAHRLAQTAAEKPALNAVDQNAAA